MKVMFKKRLLKLADVIEGTNQIMDQRGKPVKFKMSEWMAEGSCGTAACIAGHAAILSKEPFDKHSTAWLERSDTPASVAKEWLGISTDHQALELFIPTDYSNYRGELEGITRKRAAAVLRHFAETGKVDWTTRLSK